MLEFAAVLAAAYLIGGVPFGYLVARRRGVDILAQGSGNIGATNVGRVLGMRFGVLVFFLDFAKGALPVALAMLLQKYYPVEPGELLREDLLRHGLVEVGAGLLAFLGHLLPVYLGFRGGKGVATGAGVVAVLMPLPAILAMGVWVLLTVATRYISLASITAAIVLLASQLATNFVDVNDPRNWFCVLAVGLVLVRHRSNAVRLWHGTENRLPASAKLDRLAQSLHVLAVALWFGGSLFFSFVVAPLVFSTLEGITELPPNERTWLPRPRQFARSDAEVQGPKEQASRLAGRVVGGIFPFYLLLQIICGLIALAPAFAWQRTYPTDRAHRWRCGLLLAGLLFVLAGLWLEHMVHEARGPRNEAVDAYLKSQTVDDAAIEKMRSARGWFGMWHGMSVLANYAVIIMVTAVMLLAVWAPPGRESSEQNLLDLPATRI